MNDDDTLSFCLGCVVAAIATLAFVAGMFVQHLIAR